jgi:hypothetical protein
MDRSEIVTGVAKRLFAAEQNLENAFVQVAALNAELATARQEAGLAMKIGAPAICHFTDAQAHLAAARASMGKGHDSLAVVKRAIGDRTALTGGGDKTSSFAETTETV